MKILFGMMTLIFIIILASSVSALYYEKSAADCGTSWQSQNCPVDEYVCGYTGGILYCDSSANMDGALPGTDSVVSSDLYDSSLGGGYVLNCDAAATTCLPWLCQRNDTCYTTYNRKTKCIGGQTNSTCDACLDTHTYCDGSYIDGDGCEVEIGVTDCATGANNNIDGTCTCVCDSGYYDFDGTGADSGNGCEIQNGESCTTYSGSLPGTCTSVDGSSGYDSQGNNCTCQVAKSYFETGTDTSYGSSDPLLWGTQVGSGYLMNLTNSTGGSLLVDEQTCIEFNDATTLCSATGLDGGDTAGGWDNSTGTIVSYAGQNVSVDTNVLYIDTTNNRVGIGIVPTTHALHVSGDIQLGDGLSYTPSAYTDFVVGSSSTDSRFLFGQSNSAYGGLRWAYNAVAANAFLEIYTNQDQDIIFSLNGGEKARIESGGDVGIGTSNPTKKLEVSDGSKGLTVDPTVADPTINTTANSNVTITSSAGSVIIQLG